MSDQPNSAPNNQATKDGKSFEDLLSSYEYHTPKPGQLLEGVILRIDEDGILVDIGVKRDAIVPSKDLSQIAPELIEGLSAGDTVYVYVINQPTGDRELLVSLSKGFEHESWEKATQFLENGDNIELEVIGHNRGGLIIEFDTLRGFLPYSQVPGLRGIRSPKLAERIKREMVGTRLEMKVIEVVRERNRLIFSATAAEDEKKKKRLEELERGEIIEGKVVNIVDFGIFVDLDGVDGLVHLSELDWKKIQHPSDEFKAGDDVVVKVLDVDVERERVSLSRKALLPSPWESPEDLPQPGSCIEGQVVKLVNFGAFVQIPAGVEGLVHNSQIGYTHTENPKDALKRGEKVLVRVMDLDPARRRISLSMRQVPRELQISWAMENLMDDLLDKEAPQPETTSVGSDDAITTEGETEGDTTAKTDPPVEEIAENETQSAPKSEAESESSEAESLSPEVDSESPEPSAAIESADAEEDDTTAEVEKPTPDEELKSEANAAEEIQTPAPVETDDVSDETVASVED